MSNRKLVWAAIVLPTFLFATSAANAACAPISDAAGLQAMQNNLARSYCLTADIDLSSIANFTPVGSAGNPFVGKFNGNNHVISNLRITSSGLRVALFGAANSGPIQNVTLTNARIKATATDLFGPLVGTLVGEGNGTILRNVHVEGSVTCTDRCTAGGLAAQAFTIENSSAAVNVTALVEPSNAAGAIFQTMPPHGTITASYATGRVMCGNGAACGGFAGNLTATVIRSHASGNVTCSGGFCGGFGATITDSSFTDVYATGAVTITTGFRGGFLGDSGNSTFVHAFAAGAVEGGAGGGGFAGGSNGSTFTDVYWDTDTSGMTSDGSGTSGAVGKTTAQMQAALPAGFDPKIWGITRGLSYPYLKKSPFRSTLATLVVASDIYTFLPLSELDPSNYIGATDHIDQASQAACYTMIARGIGESQDVPELQNMKIDKAFWVDSSQTTFWRGKVKNFAKRGRLKPIASDVALDDNVVTELKSGKLVMLRGVYQDGVTQRESWMLATLITGRPRKVGKIVANDPFTGTQVEIDPATKMVTSPASFPLAQFTVTDYQPITILPPAP